MKYTYKGEEVNIVNIDWVIEPATLEIETENGYMTVFSDELTPDPIEVLNGTHASPAPRVITESVYHHKKDSDGYTAIQLLNQTGTLRLSPSWMDGGELKHSIPNAFYMEPQVYLAVMKALHDLYYCRTCSVWYRHAGCCPNCGGEAATASELADGFLGEEA